MALCGFLGVECCHYKKPLPHWVNCYTQMPPKIKVKIHPGISSSGKCENHELIKAWLVRVKGTIENMGLWRKISIIWMKLAFKWVLLQLIKLSVSVPLWVWDKESHTKALQPGNREWVTWIVAINASGWALPA